MCFQVVAREHRITSGVVVVVAAAFGGACTGVVLGEAEHGLFAPAQIFALVIVGGLHGVYISSGDVQSQLRIFAVGAAGTLHGSAGSNVDLGSQQGGNARGTVFLGGLHADLGSQVRVHGGSQSGGLHQAGDVGRVDGDHGRNAVVAALGNGLDLVGPLGVLCAATADVTGNTATATGLQEGAGPIILSQRIGGEVAPAAVGENSRHLGAFHLAHQVCGTLFGGQTPVFVGVQSAVLVQVFEGVAVIFNDLHAGVGRKAQNFAAFIFQLQPAVLGGGDSVLGALTGLRHVAAGLRCCGGGRRGGSAGGSLAACGHAQRHTNCEDQCQETLYVFQG